MTTDRSEQSGPEVDVLRALDRLVALPTVVKNLDGEYITRMDTSAVRRQVAALLTERASHQQAVEALRERAESAEARLARVAGVLADLRGRLTPSADFLADQIAAAIAPQEVR